MIWLIGMGGALGAMTRYLLGIIIKTRVNAFFPLPTFLINISGSFLLGVIFQLSVNGSIGDSLFNFLGIGFCGAYTTFSTFSVEALQLLVEKRVLLALTYVILSMILSLLAAFLGMSLEF